MLTTAFRVPVAVGVNVTAIVQFALGATPVPQVLVWEKSPAFVPVMLILVMCNGVTPMFVRVALWGELVVPTAWSPKANLDFENETTVPLPSKTTACGLAGSESLMANSAFLLSFAFGVNATEIVQLALGANVASQVLVSAKSPRSKPVI
jgi:hypothetical protein